MGAGEKGYAYFVDSNGDTKLLYTSNGKTFDIVLDACFIPGYDSGFTPPTTDEDATEGATDGATDGEAE